MDRAFHAIPVKHECRKAQNRNQTGSAGDYQGVQPGPDSEIAQSYHGIYLSVIVPGCKIDGQVPHLWYKPL